MQKKISLPPEKSLGHQVRRCHLGFDRILSARLDREGLNSGYWYYLRALWIQDGQIQGDLSKLTHVAENTTTAMIKSMIKRGLVRRVRDAEDGRKARIYLTERGRKLEAELLHYGIQINEVAMKGISREDINTCLAVLARAGANLHEALGDEMPTSRPRR